MKSKLKTTSHIIAGLLILLHGLERIETGGRFLWFYLIMGTLVLTLAFFHEKLKSGDAIFAFIESIMIFFIAIEMFERHKIYLPWIYLVAALVYFYAGFRLVGKSKTKRA